MSGGGKSYWSQKLERQGFVRYCCDDLIEEKLAPRLVRPDGTRMDMGKWMGLPFEQDYRERAALYLEYEKEVMHWILDKVSGQGNRNSENIVIDTTGSVIYTGKEIMEGLRRQTCVVHLATPAEIQDKMLSAFLENPGPMLWMDTYDRKEGESDLDALRRCYPLLLTDRERLYSQYADVTIDYHTRRRTDFSASDFLSLIIRVANERHGCPANSLPRGPASRPDLVTG